jgi:type IV pilus assembly protein PilQ
MKKKVLRNIISNGSEFAKMVLVYAKNNPKIVMLTGLLVVLIFSSTVSFKALSQQNPATSGEVEIGRGEIFESEKGKLNISFRNADIRNVLRLISEKSGVNIIAARDVTGSITVSLENVEWDDALKAILSAHDYGYERKGNIITVMSFERLASKSERESKLAEIQPVISEVFHLKYLDANDVADAVKGLISSRGSVSVVQIRGQRGWKFGAGERQAGIVRAERLEGEVESRSKILLVSDIPASVDKVRELIKRVDTRPKQVLIEARIIEVNHDKLKDLGIDWGTGRTGAEGSALEYLDLKRYELGGHMLGYQVTPSVFDPEATDITSSNTGLELGFRKLSGSDFQMILHALAEDVDANTLSSPKILTLDNQAAAILVGEKYPIVQTEVSTETSQITGGSLEYYEDIGIQLNVIPQICGPDNNFINMIIHPIVSSRLADVTITGQDGTALASYPRLRTREAQSQVLLKDGETVVMGGLLKDVEQKGVIKTPFLGDIPLFGLLFQRRTTKTTKIDLLIFITAKIVDEPTLSQEDLVRFDESK